MIWLLGLMLGSGAVLVAAPWLWPARERRVRRERSSWLGTLAAEAGVVRLTPGALLLLSVAVALVSGAVVWLFMRIAIVALVAVVAGFATPVLVLRSLRQRRRTERRTLWPDVCDLLVASTRAGMSLPEAVSSLAEAAPEPLRPAFSRFRADLAASGHFDSSIVRLKATLADATADRIIETLRMARQVGGTKLPSVLRALSSSVRAEAAVRAEVTAKQSWVRAAAILGVVAPWAILGLLSLRPEARAAYASAGGVALIVATAVISVIAYRVMSAIGALPEPRRWFE